MSIQPMKTPLRAPERGKEGGSTLCSALAGRPTDSMDPRSRRRQNSASEQDLWEMRRHSPSTSSGGQDHGVPRGDGKGEPSRHPADG
jgi:hypothetical protein